MRHQKAGKKLSRTSAHRQAMFSNMITSLILHDRIETTEAKAKELKRLADRTISWGMSVADVATKDAKSLKPADRSRVVHAKRMAARIVRSSEALAKLFDDVAPRLKDRKGGFTRLLKTRVRPGDSAPMAFVEILERGKGAEAAPAPAPEEKKAKGKKAEAKAAPEAKAEGQEPAAKPKRSRKKTEAAED